MHKTAVVATAGQGGTPTQAEPKGRNTHNGTRSADLPQYIVKGAKLAKNKPILALFAILIFADYTALNF